MDATIFGIAGALLGVLLGSLLTHWNSTALARLEMKWQQVRLRQEKLEEIAALIDQIDHHYRIIMGDIILKIENDKPFEFNGERIPFERLRILMEFYAPTMIKDWAKLENAKNNFGEVLSDAISNVQRTKSEKQDINGRACSAHNRMAKVCRLLSERAAFLSHEAVSNETGKKS